MTLQVDKEAHPTVDSVDQALSARSATLMFCLVLAAACGPPLLGLHLQGVEVAFKSFAADAFYYLAIADHSVGADFYTFDRVHPTNGFHPLWAYYLSGVFGLLPSSQKVQVLTAYLSSVAFTATGAALFSLCLLRISARPALTLIAAVHGF
jgi:hypothetical protein